MKKSIFFALLLTIGVMSMQAQNYLLKGKFQVREGEYARFVSGNLNYNLATEKFAVFDKQYLSYDELNANIASYVSSNTGTIDLFGWGTSGYQSAPAIYKADNSLFAPNVADNQALETGGNRQHDWGYHNTIGSDEGPFYYFTPNRFEWNYLMQNRPNADKLRGTATITADGKDYVGFVFLPDNWALPLNLTFVPDVRDYSNKYTAEQWQQMENAGALFLPCAGYRNGQTYVKQGYCTYWSSNSAGSADGSDYQGKALYAFVNDWTADGMANRYMGYAVRLIQWGLREQPTTLTQTETHEINEGESYEWHGVKLSKPGVYNYTELEVQDNTDRITTLTLTFKGQGIESVQQAATNNKKVLRDGQLLIERNGELFNAQGARVK